VQGEDEGMADVDPDKLHKFARKSIELMWRVGIMLLNRRVRRIADLAIGSLDNKQQKQAAASALLELGEACRCRKRAILCAKELAQDPL
jgi:hypothetical protein